MLHKRGCLHSSSQRGAAAAARVDQREAARRHRRRSSPHLTYSCAQAIHPRGGDCRALCPEGQGAPLAVDDPKAARGVWYALHRADARERYCTRWAVRIISPQRGIVHQLGLVVVALTEAIGALGAELWRGVRLVERALQKGAHRKRKPYGCPALAGRRSAATRPSKGLADGLPFRGRPILHSRQLTVSRRIYRYLLRWFCSACPACLLPCVALRCPAFVLCVPVGMS